MAENFIHRVGRTGRAGERGVASTLFVREQRSELIQLERTLGIKMERMSADVGKSVMHTRKEKVYTAASSLSRMARLPGEILQAQMVEVV